MAVLVYKCSAATRIPKTFPKSRFVLAILKIHDVNFKQKVLMLIKDGNQAKEQYLLFRPIKFSSFDKTLNQMK